MKARGLALGAPEKSSSRASPGGSLPPPPLNSFFNQAGLSAVAGRAALVRAGDDPVTAVENAARAGAAAVVLYGTAIPAGGLGLGQSVPPPGVARPDDVARTAPEARTAGRQPAPSLGASRVARDRTG